MYNEVVNQLYSQSHHSGEISSSPYEHPCKEKNVHDVTVIAFHNEV